ncbi:hypothetical protein ABC795_12120 [Blastococcus sp. HT6-30]|uniref:hypothetical protein n=1 Tax=Blastococcus sp. HT6-30 TaxID=3144843 RepID=UPI00321C313C
MTESRPSSRRPSPLVLVAVVVGTAVAVGAFLLLDPIVAAAVAITAVTAVGVVAAASNWDSHATFEERELARARRRKEKWERNAGARAKDRARWEAHQARKARKAAGATGTDRSGR